jgi:hypothetical protein
MKHHNHYCQQKVAFGGRDEHGVSPVAASASGHRSKAELLRLRLKNRLQFPDLSAMRSHDKKSDFVIEHKNNNYLVRTGRLTVRSR